MTGVLEFLGALAVVVLGSLAAVGAVVVGAVLVIAWRTHRRHMRAVARARPPGRFEA